MRKLLAASLVGVLLCVSFGSADLVTPRKLTSAERILGMGIRPSIERFKAHERALVMVSGVYEGDTCMGLYIFDAQGNCVAKDDLTTNHSSDELAVEWVPPDTTPCCVEVRNAGHSLNAFYMAVR